MKKKITCRLDMVALPVIPALDGWTLKDHEFCLNQGEL